MSSHRAAARIHTYDIFDTTLLRSVPVPSDVFYIVGERISTKTLETVDRHFIESFVAARIEAQRIALTKSPNEETTLETIWAVLATLIPILPACGGPELELDVEASVIVANSAVTDLIGESRRAEKQVIFVSDTYFPLEFIKTQLLRCNAAGPDDKFYLSSEFGVTKRSGGLFKKLMQTEGAAPFEISHLGDNLDGDLRVPNSLGIAASIVSDGGLNHAERSVLLKGFSSPLAAIGLVGAMRVARRNLQSDIRGLGDLVGSFLGPVIVVWAAWLLASAERDHIRRLYFISRDGYLLCRAASILASSFGNIDCRYLQISRQSTMLPGVGEINESELSWIHQTWETPRLGILLAKLALKWSDVAPHFAKLAGSAGESKLLRSPQEWMRFWEIIKSPPVRDAIEQRILACRATAVAYLHRMGLCDGTPSALVDVGWAGKVQSRVKRLVGEAGSVSAYYLGATWNRRLAIEAGTIDALFYEHNPDRREVVRDFEIFRRGALLEHVLGLAPHGTVREYVMETAGAVPICPEIDPKHAALVTAAAAAVEQFAAEQKADIRRYADEPIAREILNILIESWTRHPPREALLALQPVLASDDQNNAEARSIVEPWPLCEAVLALVPWRLRRVLGIKLKTPHWPEASKRTATALTKFLLNLRKATRTLGL